MYAISRRKLDKLMRFILDYYLSDTPWSQPLTSLTPQFLNYCFSIGLTGDLGRALQVLVGEKLIRLDLNEGTIAQTIILTADGKCYFEKKADERRKFWMNSILVPILVAIITSFVTVYILPSVGKRAEQWLQRSPACTEQAAPTALAPDAP